VTVRNLLQLGILIVSPTFCRRRRKMHRSSPPHQVGGHPPYHHSSFSLLPSVRSSLTPTRPSSQNCSDSVF
jgi:hypothetical protein